MTDIVTLTNLTKTYNGIPALRDVTMTIPSGKIVGLLGPNGSGKTTLIKILNGLLQPTSGLVTINGFEPSPITKSQVAYLPDTTYLDESKTIQYYLGTSSKISMPTFAILLPCNFWRIYTFNLIFVSKTSQKETRKKFS